MNSTPAVVSMVSSVDLDEHASSVSVRYQDEAEDQRPDAGGDRAFGRREQAGGHAADG